MSTLRLGYEKVECNTQGAKNSARTSGLDCRVSSKSAVVRSRTSLALTRDTNEKEAASKVNNALLEIILSRLTGIE
jgi:hypothetical protein